MTHVIRNFRVHMGEEFPPVGVTYDEEDGTIVLQQSVSDYIYVTVERRRDLANAIINAGPMPEENTS